MAEQKPPLKRTNSWDFPKDQKTPEISIHHHDDEPHRSSFDGVRLERKQPHDEHRVSLDSLRVDRKERPSEPPRSSFDVGREKLFATFRRATKKDPTPRNSLDSGSYMKILALPKKILLKIFNYLDSNDFSNTWYVSIQFRILTKEVVRARWRSLLPRSGNPRPTLIRSQSTKQLKEVPHVEPDHAYGSEAIQSLSSNPAWQKVANLLFPQIFKSPSEVSHRSSTLVQNPFTLDPTIFDILQIPHFSGTINSVATSDPLPMFFVKKKETKKIEKTKNYF